MVSSLTKDQSRLLSYLLTRAEYERLTRLLQPYLLLPALQSTSSQSIKDDNALSPTVSRQSTRLFSLIFSVVVVYENLLLGLIRRKKVSQILRSLQLSSSFRLASFVASFSAVYRLLLSRFRSTLPSLAPSVKGKQGQMLSLTRLRRNVLVHPALPAFLAGIAASPTMLLEGRGQRRVTMAVYALTRALHAIVIGAGNKGLLAQSMVEGRWWWGGHLIFALANGFLLHAFVYNPTTFPKAYESFILRFSSAYLPPRPNGLASNEPWPSPRECVDAIAVASRMNYPSFISPLLHPSASKSSFDNTTLDKILPILKETHPGHSRLTCSFLHPNQVSCSTVSSSFIKKEFYSASKFFGSLSLLGILIRWKKSLNSPDVAIYKALLSTFTSSAFLSLSLGTSWSLICGLQHYLPNSFLPTKRFFVQGFLAASWVVLVGKQRATDLGLYASRLAIQSVWDNAVIKNKVRNIRNGEILYFALSMGTLMAFHDAYPSAINSSFVSGALRRIGGPSSAAAESKESEIVEARKRRGSTTTRVG